MQLTRKTAHEIISHEAIVREAYKDSKGIWTWGIGVTNASGHTVDPRYVDNPQSIKKCLEVYIWLLKLKYIPDVVDAFDGHMLTEAQFAAALSFHFNTGAIKRAGWVTKWKAGAVTAARKAIMEYKRPPEIVPRRTAERNLFFDGIWSGTGKATIWPVKKPSYTPDWAHPSRIDVSGILDELIPQ